MRRTYRIKQGILKIHEPDQATDYSYWRTVVPNNQEVKIELLREIHCVPYSGHPGFTRTLEVTRRFFYWVHMTQEVRQFVLDCPVCQIEKGSHLKPAGKLMPLEIPMRKWDHVAIDFVVGLPMQDKCDTICTVVDKATKMCHFIPCSEKISAKQVAQLYWQYVGKLHGIPSVLISDRDVRFTSKFWKELWRLLGTNLRMGSGFHPESSGQVEKFNQLLEQTLRCTVHQLGETRNWLEVLPVIEFAVNNTPNRTTGYSAFYLNYGYHPLHPLQLLHSPEETRNEAVVQFTSRLQSDFQAAVHQLNKAKRPNDASNIQCTQDRGIPRRRLGATQYETYTVPTVSNKTAKKVCRSVSDIAEDQYSSIQVAITCRMDNASSISHFITKALA